MPAVLPKEIEEIGNVPHARVADQSVYRVIGFWVRTAHSGLVRSDRTEDVLRETVALLHVDNARIAEPSFESVGAADVGEIVVPARYLFRENVAYRDASAKISYPRDGYCWLSPRQRARDVLLIPVGIGEAKLVDHLR